MTDAQMIAEAIERFAFHHPEVLKQIRHSNPYVREDALRRFHKAEVRRASGEDRRGQDAASHSREEGA